VKTKVMLSICKELQSGSLLYLNSYVQVRKTTEFYCSSRPEMTDETEVIMYFAD